MTKKSNLKKQEGFLLISSVFDLGNSQIMPESLLGMSTTYVCSGKPVSEVAFRLNTFAEKDVRRHEILLVKDGVSMKGLAEKLVRATSTIEFSPKGKSMMSFYFFVEEVSTDKETSVTTYKVRQGQRSNSLHVKVQGY